MTSVNTTAVSLGGDAKLLQNLGPDDLYIQVGSGVSSSTGYKLVTGEAIAIGYSNLPIYVVSSGTSEVRSLVGGTGKFSKQT